MGYVESFTTVSAPVDFAFEYTADYRNVPKWMLGVHRCEAVTQQVRGVGTKLDGTIDVGPKKLAIGLEVIEWIDDEYLDFVVTGLPGGSTSSWRFESLPNGGTKITAYAEWQLKGLAGKALDKILQAFAKLAVAHVKKQLSMAIEQSYAPVGESA
jgi:hypothetical protein